MMYCHSFQRRGLFRRRCLKVIGLPFAIQQRSDIHSSRSALICLVFGFGVTQVGSLRAEDWLPKKYATIEVPVAGNVAFSPDGKSLAVYSGFDTIVLWDVATRRVTGRLKRESYPSENLIYSPDSKSLYFDGAGNVARLDLTTGKSVELYRHNAIVTRIAVSADGTQLASNALPAKEKKGEIRLWDLAAGKLRKSLQSPMYLMDLAFSPDGKRLAAGFQDDRGSIWVWDLAGKQQSRQLPGSKFSGDHIAISPDGKKLVSGGKAGNALFVFSFAADMEPVTWDCRFATGPLTFTSNSRMIVAAGGRRVAVLDAGTGKVMKEFEAIADRGTPFKPSRIGWMSLSPDNKLLAVTSATPKDEVIVYDISSITASQRDKGRQKK